MKTIKEKHRKRKKKIVKIRPAQPVGNREEEKRCTITEWACATAREHAN